ncbi:thioredoxin domain-containing protein 12-like isoform X2 [Dreissena polymorpha]|uniref:Thioredoxin domain-containing protein 12 n=1 Tax=Dreissena polymorpha TaxID=45954 RepID=A0A9D4L333_DREPO|nr:thioredoxin domain-containing protein 12-like isoform X1 [Dreissena polymorpha]XP_052274801.1 thioredoxin domain-containing protein 12-like isoform X2 [Dreissena polymorpha]KAH3850419.1 hypothetical protein DPMN_092830 [Dreissena polymorpha]
MLSASSCSIFLLSCVSISLGSDLSNGWGEHIDWQKFDDAFKIAEEENKPVMLLIHKSWCGACKNLKPKFAESEEIATLSKNFVMVNVMDDDEPEDAKYKPDGGYIPRILFIDHGDVMKDLYNESGNPKYKYYYHSPDHIMSSMERALKQLEEGFSHVSDEL